MEVSRSKWFPFTKEVSGRLVQSGSVGENLAKPFRIKGKGRRLELQQYTRTLATYLPLGKAEHDPPQAPRRWELSDQKF